MGEKIDKGIRQFLVRTMQCHWKARWVFYLLEACLLDLELNLLNLKTRSSSVIAPSIDTVPPFSLIGIFDLQSRLESAASSLLFWTLTTLVTFSLLLLITFSFTSSKIDLHSFEDSILEECRQASLKKHPSFMQYLLLYSGHLFYFLVYFCMSMLACERSYQTFLTKSTQINEDFPVVEIPNSQLTSSSEIKVLENTIWTVSPKIFCFGGYYLMSAGLVLCIFLCAIAVKLFGNKIQKFYPSVLIVNSKRNNMDLVELFSFITLHTLRLLIVGRFITSVVVYIWVLMTFYILQLFIILVTQPYHNSRLVKFIVFKKLFIIVVAVLGLLLRNQKQEWLLSLEGKKNMAVLTLFLISFTAYFSRSLVEMSFETGKFDPSYSKFASLATAILPKHHYSKRLNLSKLVYDFERYKYALSKSRPAASESDSQEAWSTSQELDTLNFRVASFVALHRKLCKDPLCQCRETPSLASPQWKIEGCPLCSQSNPWIVNFLHILSREFQLEIGIIPPPELKQEANIQLVRLWTLFSGCNFGKSTGALRLTQKILEQNQTDKSFFPFLTRIFTKYFDLEVSKDFVDSIMIGHEHVQSRETWQSILRPAKDRSVEMHKFFVVSQYSNYFREAVKQLAKTIDSKIELLHGYGIRNPKLLQLSESYIHNCHKTEKLINKLRTEGLFIYYPMISLEVQYLQFVKEDLMKTRKMLGAVMNKYPSTNVYKVLQVQSEIYAPNTETIVIGASAEEKTFHQITYCTKNIFLLDFASQELIHKDLSMLLPSCVASKHRQLADPNRVKAFMGSFSPNLDMAVKKKDGFVLECKVNFKVNFSTKFGIEYLGVLYVELTCAKKKFCLINREGIITDVSQTAIDYLQPKNAIIDYFPDVNDLVETYSQVLTQISEKPVSGGQRSDLSKDSEAMQLLLQKEQVEKNFDHWIEIDSEYLEEFPGRLLNLSVIQKAGKKLMLRISAATSTRCGEVFFKLSFRHTTDMYFVTESAMVRAFSPKKKTIKPHEKKFEAKKPSITEVESTTKHAKVVTGAKAPLPSFESLSRTGSYPAESPQIKFFAKQHKREDEKAGPLNILLIGTNTQEVQDGLPTGTNLIDPPDSSYQNKDKDNMDYEKLRKAAIRESPPLEIKLSKKSAGNPRGSIFGTSQIIVPERPMSGSIWNYGSMIGNFFEQNLKSRQGSERAVGVPSLSRSSQNIAFDIKEVPFFEDPELSQVGSVRSGMSSQFKHSRNVHTKIKFKHINTISLGIILTAMAMYAEVIYICRMQSNSFTNLTHIITDVSLLDSQEFIMWTLTADVISMDLIRLVREGALPSDFLKAYGIPDTVEHLMDYRDDGENAENQVLASASRMSSLLIKSRFSHKYDLDLFFEHHYDVLVYEGKEASFKVLEERSMVNILQYINMLEMTLQTTDYMLNCSTGLQGDAASRRKCPLEEALRYNKLNPLVDHYLNSRP